MEELDAAMRDLRDAMRGIPIRRGSFTKTHDNLARDVAQVTTMLDAARPFCARTTDHTVFPAVRDGAPLLAHVGRPRVPNRGPHTFLRRPTMRTPAVSRPGTGGPGAIPTRPIGAEFRVLAWLCRHPLIALTAAP